MTGILGINPVAGQESPRNGGFVLSHANGSLSFDQGVLAALNDAATSYVAGTVIGKQTIGSTGAYGAPASGGATCGTIVLSAGIQQGVYTIVFYANSATSQFDVFAPDGSVLGKGAVGSAFSKGGLGFTLTDASGHVAVDETATITIGAASFAVVGGSVSTPTCGAIVIDPGVLGGVYTFTMIDATHFTGVDPLGRALPNGVYATGYKGGGLEFTITAGGAGAVAGDQFTITTTEGNGKWSPVSATAFDGTQKALGVLWAGQYVGGATDLKVTVLVRNAEVNDVDLAWPSTMTDDQWLNWILQLEAAGIKKRTGIK